MSSQRQIADPDGSEDGRGHRRGWRGLLRPLPALLLVGLLFVVAQLALVPLGRDLENDEAVYLSQVSRFTVPAPWEAHRAWGVALLLLPVGMLTESVLAMRVYLVLVSAVALVLAFRPWLRVLPHPAAAVAAVLFGSSWVTLFYASEASPNLYVGLAGVAAVGYVARLLAQPADRTALVGLAAALACAALFRPTDSVWLSLPALAVAALGLRTQWRTVSAVVVGLAVGWAPWLVEAFVRFDGPLARFEAARAPAGSGFGFTLSKHLRLLDGDRTCCFSEDRVPYVPVPGLLWWVGLSLLAVLGPVLVRSRAARRGAALALGTGVVITLAYLVLTRFAVSRFMLPTYALFAVPASLALVAAVRRFRTPAAARLGLAVVVLVGAADLTWHSSVARKIGRDEVQARAAFPVLAQALRARGLVPSCVLLGQRSQNIGYHADCVSGGTGTSRDLRNPARARQALRDGHRVAYLWRGGLPRNSYLREWTAVPLSEVGPGWRMYAPPGSSWLIPAGTAAR